MAEYKPQQVMDRKKIADAINAILNTGVELLAKDNLEQSDFGKLKIIKAMGTGLTASIAMVQQETAQQRIAVVIERMKQLGYETKALS